MLLNLTIENYALIDQLTIDFHEGFSVITGETGAGKSILLGALSLIVGQRADSAVLLDKSRKCIVEASFDIKEYDLTDFFTLNDLDYDEILILRREISQNGKSRAFVNDTPVNLALLKELGDKLVNIHSQNSIVTLNDTNFQLAILDNYANNTNDVRAYRQLFARYTRLSKELEELVQKEIQSRNERDYYQFLFNELQNAGLKEGEQEEIEHHLTILTHAEEIKTSLFRAMAILSENDTSLLKQISDLIHLLSGLSAFHSPIGELGERLKGNLIDLKDITHEIDRIYEEVVFDPGEASRLTERLDLIYHIEKKHNVATVSELLEIKEDIDKRLSEVNSLDEKIKKMHSEHGDLTAEVAASAKKISQKRIKGIGPIESSVKSLLTKLGMPDGQLRIEHTILDMPARDGIDKVRFLFSANKGTELNEISKIASGGELSRLMLSIKSLISQKNLLPTIIFDEIDSGVSGEIAGKVGAILKKMAKTMQVIVITHLPQIAGKGDTHYFVFKVKEKSFSRSCIRILENDERIHEIAKMLSNEKVTESAFNTAKELLSD